MRIKLLSLFFFMWTALFATSQSHAESCSNAGCHKAIADIKNIHEPVKKEECQACHQQRSTTHPVSGEKNFQLTAKGAALCNQCHDRKEKKKVVHPPDCLFACHKPHGAAGRFLLDNDKDLTGLCVGCHKITLPKQKYMHGPAAVGSCAVCHDPHQSSEKALLKGPVRSLCLKCHQDFAKSLNAAPIIHLPVKEDSCTSCHDPHGSQEVMFLKEKMPDLCLDCHENIAEKIQDLKVPHKPVKETRGCGNCHSPHYATAKGLFAVEEKELCLSCHNTDKLGSLRNIKKDIEGKKYLHGPISKGDCKACHDPHGSNSFRMLKGNYPADLYVPYKDGVYEACLNCHEKKLLRYADTTLYTKFRNGNRNLHYVHVAIKRKGRTCRVCHEAHASNGEKLISKEGSQFGDWKIPLNFQINSNGGRCAPGCHRAFSYDREKPVSYVLEENKPAADKPADDRPSTSDSVSKTEAN
ncbi:MAG TPA: cytochrome c3 family protein [Desulfuromonadaceae bacterium]